MATKQRSMRGRLINSAPWKCRMAGTRRAQVAVEFAPTAPVVAIVLLVEFNSRLSERCRLGLASQLSGGTLRGSEHQCHPSAVRAYMICVAVYRRK
jgi:hypothetical protein